MKFPFFFLRNSIIRDDFWDAFDFLQILQTFLPSNVFILLIFSLILLSAHISRRYFSKIDKKILEKCFSQVYDENNKKSLSRRFDAMSDEKNDKIFQPVLQEVFSHTRVRKLFFFASDRPKQRRNDSEKFANRENGKLLENN